MDGERGASEELANHHVEKLIGYEESHSLEQEESERGKRQAGWSQLLVPTPSEMNEALLIHMLHFGGRDGRREWTMLLHRKFG